MNKTYIWLSLLFLLTAGNGCAAYYPDMMGTVVDAATGQPIEGAVVLVEWTRKRGIGDYHTELIRIDEVITSSAGSFEVSGVKALRVDAPRLTVYKKGYVAWNSQYVFPSWDRRTDFEWSSHSSFRLIPFGDAFSRSEHVFFLHSVTHWGKMINEAYRWEELEMEKSR